MVYVLCTVLSSFILFFLLYKTLKCKSKLETETVYYMVLYCVSLCYIVQQVSPRAHLHVVGMLRLCLWHKPAELAHSFLFCSYVCFCLYGPSNCISFHKFSRQLSAFSLCSSSLISALLVLSAIYLFTKASFSPNIILCDWLLSHQHLTNCTVT